MQTCKMEFCWWLIQIERRIREFPKIGLLNPFCVKEVKINAQFSPH